MNHLKSFLKMQQNLGQPRKQENIELDLQAWAGSEYKNIQIITLEGLEDILNKSPKNLKFISFRARNFDQRIVPMITTRNFQSLKSLSFDFNNIGSLGCKLMSFGQWNALQSLQLQHNNIEDLGVKYLIRMKSPQLSLLSLKSNLISNEGVRVLLKNNFKNLRVLYLHSNRANFEGLKLFVGSPTPTTRLYLTLFQGQKTAASTLHQLLKSTKANYEYIEVSQ